MLLGYNTNGLVHHRLEDALRLMADEGFEAVALTPDVGQLDPFTCTAKDVARIASLLQELGLYCVVETGARFLLDPRRKHHPTLLDRDKEARQRRISFYERCIHMATDLGAKALSFWSGGEPKMASDAGTDALLEEGIARLLSMAERHDLPLALEAEPGMYIETQAQAKAVLERLGMPQLLGLTVDIGHLYVTGEGSPQEILPGLRGLIRQIHVEDIRLAVHEHLPPGEGDVDFKELWQSLDAIGYCGPVCFELSRSSHQAPQMLALSKACFLDR